jgi:hypothetical protein
MLHPDPDDSSNRHQAQQPSDRASRDPSCWRDPIVHRALLVSGLSVLTTASTLLLADLEQT